MTKLSYLQRLHQRQRKTQFKEQLVFGFTLGWLLTLVGGFKHLFIVNQNEMLWRILFYLGVGLLVSAFFLPSIIKIFQIPMKKLTVKIGETIFSLILIASYFLLIFPIGLLFKNKLNKNLFYRWTEEKHNFTARWIDYKKEETIINTKKYLQSRSLIVQFAWVIDYFIRNGYYLFIPVLILLLILGLVMFFVKASAFAPFIYTLF